MIRTPDENLKQFATEKQWAHYLVVCEEGSQRKAALRLGRAHSTIQNNMALMYRNAAKGGYVAAVEPELVLKGQSILYKGDVEVGRWDKTKLEGRDPLAVAHVPDPKLITKISTNYDQAGRVVQQWIAEKPEDVAKEALWRAFAAELSKDVVRAKAVPLIQRKRSDLLACYPVGDHHLGGLSWAEETGGDSYDLKIGEQLLRDGSTHLIRATPACLQSLIVFLGDFLHYDSFDSVTPTSRNQLDAEGRFPKMVRVALRAMRHMITAALEHHEKVNVIVEIGNHDLASSIWLMECLANVYENDPRVAVDTSPMHYHYFEFGRTMIGTHHGHGTKMEKLPGIMAHDRAEAWGRTQHRYWLTGHIHTRVAVELPGCSVESFNILAPPDAWAAQKGYRSARNMKALVYDRAHGEVERHVVNPDMLKAKE